MHSYLVSIQGRPEFYAERLWRAFKGNYGVAFCRYSSLTHWLGLGTDDDAVIRTVVQRAEIDMENIKEAYQRLYGRSLTSAIKVSPS